MSLSSVPSPALMRWSQISSVLCGVCTMGMSLVKVPRCVPGILVVDGGQILGVLS